MPKEELEQLYQRHKKLIRDVAAKAAKAFNYSDIEELCSVGTLAFIELLNSGAYDPEKGELSTYLSPWLRGTMFRYLEKNTGALSLSKHQMELIRKAQRLYHEANMAADAVAKELGISLAHAAQLINYNTHSIPFRDLYEDEQNCPIIESVEYSVLRNIQIELLEKQFRLLSTRDQYILGSCLGVFGFEQKSVDELAFEEMLTPDGIYKAKEAALVRLRGHCMNSAIPLWRQAHSMTQRMAQNP